MLASAQYFQPPGIMPSLLPAPDNQADNSTIKPITAETHTQYDWAKTLSKSIFQRFIKHAQAARFISMDLLQWESLKEISTILTIWDTLKKHIPYSPDDKLIVLDVGAGPKPKLGAWIALNTDWPVLSIDPVLQTPKSVLPDNLTLIAKPVEEVNLSEKYDLSEYHVVVLMMHAHVSTEQACLPVKTCKRLSLITIPCCGFTSRQNSIHNVPFDFEFEARDMSPTRGTVRVWRFKSFPIIPTRPLQKDKCIGIEEVNEVHPLYAEKNVQHIKVDTANIYSEYDDTIEHIDHFINHWQMSLRSSRHLMSEDVFSNPWLFRKNNMISWLSRAIHVEGIAKEILPDKYADRKTQESVSVVIVEAGRTPRFGAWLSGKLKKKMISICKPSDSKQLSPHWKVGVNLETCSLEDLDIEKKNYVVIVVSDEFTPDGIAPLFHQANRLSMIFNTSYPCHRRGQIKPDESRLIWNVISPLRRFHIWHSVPLSGRT